MMNSKLGKVLCLEKKWKGKDMFERPELVQKRKKLEDRDWQMIFRYSEVKLF